MILGFVLGWLSGGIFVYVFLINKINAIKKQVSSFTKMRLDSDDKPLEECEFYCMDDTETNNDIPRIN